MTSTAAPVRPIDLPGIVRRARRVADMSQRDLARATGLSAGTVARAELGDTPVSLAALLRILEVAGLRLAVLDSAGQEVEPMRADALRDNAGRRYPAHLDARLPRWPRHIGAGMPRSRPIPHLYCEQRRGRDAERTRTGTVPSDHPGEDDKRRLQRERTRAQQEAYARMRANRPPEPPLVECFCGPECESYCAPDCECQCEPKPGRPPNLIRRWPQNQAGADRGTPATSPADDAPTMDGSPSRQPGPAGSGPADSDPAGFHPAGSHPAGSDPGPNGSDRGTRPESGAGGG